MDVAGLEAFYGLGVFFFVGAGALVSVGNWFTHNHAAATGHIDVWIQVMLTTTPFGLCGWLYG